MDFQAINKPGMLLKSLLQRQLMRLGILANLDKCQAPGLVKQQIKNIQP